MSLFAPTLVLLYQRVEDELAYEGTESISNSRLSVPLSRYDMGLYTEAVEADDVRAIFPGYLSGRSSCLVEVEYRGKQSNVILTTQGESTLKIFGE